MFAVLKKKKKITYVLSMVCTKEYIKIPLVEKRCENYISIIVNAIEIMEKNK